ncbi:MAG: agmatine deiminase family protein, partial [Verrucomicrobiota bacterium]
VGLWGGIEREEVDGVLVKLVELVGRFAEVKMCGVKEGLEELLEGRAEVLGIETDDVWCRDHGATFVREGDELVAVDWLYNGWGGKFEHGKDARVADVMAEVLGVRRVGAELVCEGGAVESNGAGVVMTTESVLLNRNRNGGWSKAGVERGLGELLGAERVVWLERGLVNDDTDGHIDMVARFVSEMKVLMVEGVEGRGVIEGAGFEVEMLPGPVEVAEGVEGSYANFLIVNGGVIVPQFGRADDERALEVLEGCFPEKEVVGFDCSVVGLEGGGVHCLTQGQWDLGAS